MNDRDTTDAPGSGYLTDHNHEGQWRKAVKFASGSISYHENYDILVEGVTHQDPQRIDNENLILIPAEEDVAWNSRIEVFGSKGTDASQLVFEQGDAIRPFGGKVDDSAANTRVIFEEGSIKRYDNYAVSVAGREVPGIVIHAEANAIEIPAKVPSRAEMVVSGLNASGKKIPVFMRVAADDDHTRPSRGFVVFHGTASTCIMLGEGDMTRFAPGYKLVHEESKSTTDHIGLAPNHIRFESVGKNIRTEVKLYALDADGKEADLLFQGRYNGSIVSSKDG